MRAESETLLEAMRKEIAQKGECVVACDQLRSLIPERASIGAQFGHIFAVAEKERWSFEFGPDGTVRFAALPPKSIS